MFSCKRCGYSTKIKGNLKNHFNRKRYCEAILEDIPIDVLTKELLYTKYKPTDVILKSEANISSKTLFTCDSCKKTFTRLDNLNRHTSKWCKKESLISVSSKNTDTLIETMYKEIQNIKSQHTKDMEILLNNMHTTTNIQNQQINININNYGNENLDYITPDFINSIIEIPYCSLPKLLTNIHFHPNHPENHNVRLTNKKLPYITIWKNNKWEVCDKKQVINELVNKGYNFLDTKYDRLIINNTSNSFNDFKQKYEDNDPILHKKLMKDIEIVMINNS